MSLPGMGTSNRARVRQAYKRYRKAGFPFILSHKLAKSKVKHHDIPSSLEHELITLCPCCGPEIIEISFEGEIYSISYYTLLPK